MRKTAVLLSFLVVVSAVAQATSPQALLDRGLASYRSGDYTAAVTDLQAAAQGFLSPDKMQTYVNTGKFEQLDKFETALVYLALAQNHLGREADARETVLRLISAERISPMYARLQLADAPEFDALVEQVVPSSTLPRAPLPPVTPATEPAQAAEAAPAEERKATQRTLAEERAERQRLIDEMVAKERERIQREADARIAEEREAAERAAAAKVAAAEQDLAQRVTAAEAEAEQRIAAAQRDADQRIAQLEKEAQERLTVAEADAAARIAAAQRDAETRIAEIQRETEQRVAAERAAAERAAAAQIAEAAAAAHRAYLTSLRQAQAFANAGDLEGANAIYVRVANAENVPRAVLAEAAVGLYRTGSFKNAAAAFQRMGTFAKGEEDLRYYNAVALYETGRYQEAQKELSCALPFIQVTDDVTRYRVKIEQTAQQTASVQ